MGAPQKIITQPGQTPPQLQGGPGQAVVDVAKVLAQMTPQARATQRLAELQKVYPLEAILRDPQGQQLFNIAQGFSTPQQQPQYPVGVNLGKVGNVAADILTLGLGKPLQRLGAKIPKPAMEGAQPTATAAILKGLAGIPSIPPEVKELASMTKEQATAAGITGKEPINLLAKYQSTAAKYAFMSNDEVRKDYDSAYKVFSDQSVQYRGKTPLDQFANELLMGKRPIPPALLKAWDIFQLASNAYKARFGKPSKPKEEIKGKVESKYFEK